MPNLDVTVRPAVERIMLALGAMETKPPKPPMCDCDCHGGIWVTHGSRYTECSQCQLKALSAGWKLLEVEYENCCQHVSLLGVRDHIHSPEHICHRMSVSMSDINRIQSLLEGLPRLKDHMDLIPNVMRAAYGHGLLHMHEVSTVRMEFIAFQLLKKVRTDMRPLTRLYPSRVKLREAGGTYRLHSVRQLSPTGAYLNDAEKIYTQPGKTTAEAYFGDAPSF